MKYDIFATLFSQLMLRKISLFLLLLASLSSYASHLRSGEISYQPVPGQPNTYTITVTIYTNTSSQADQASVDIYFSDGPTKLNVLRGNGPLVNGKYMGVSLPSSIRLNTYTTTHTYGGSGSYKISVTASNRNAGILNMTNSSGQAMYIESMISVGSGLKPMSSPVLTFPPIDPGGCANTIYKINPGAVIPITMSCVFFWKHAKGLTDTMFRVISIRMRWTLAETLFLKWIPEVGLSPGTSLQYKEKYNISFRIEKYRAGILIGYVLRDMQVTIGTCDNRPPALDPIPDICVPAGTTINYKVTSSDADGDPLTFETTGMPYDLTISPAKYTSDSAGPGPYRGATSGTFHWKTDPAHFSKYAYQVYYKVTDSHQGSSLTDIVSNFITITASAVKNVNATVYKRGFNVKWDQSIYPQAVGYNVYRKTGVSPFTADSCTTGIPLNSGYSLVGALNSPATTIYTDLNKGSGLPSGYYYCYVVTARFDGGAESAPSEPTCGLLMYPFINVLQDTLINCQGSTIPIDSTIIQFINANQQTLYSWSASSGLELTNANQQVVSVKLSTTGMHTLKIVSTSGVYVDSAKIYIQVNPLPTPKIKVFDLGGWPDSVMFYNRSINSVRAEWLFHDGTQSSNLDSVLHTFDTNGYYPIKLKVYNSLGCPDTITIIHRVVMKGVAMPNAFEPENPSDKLNTFRPLAVGLQTYFLGIWDLWGNLVWSSDELKDTAPAKGWDGTDSKGRKLPAQNYIWRMTATFIDGVVWKGVKDHFGKFHKEGTLNLLR